MPQVPAGAAHRFRYDNIEWHYIYKAALTAAFFMAVFQAQLFIGIVLGITFISPFCTAFLFFFTVPPFSLPNG